MTIKNFIATFQATIKRWVSDCLLWVHTLQCQANPQCVFGNPTTRIFSPFRYCLSFAESSHQVIAAAVALLFLHGRPSAVIGRVSATILNALDCKILRVPVTKCPLRKSVPLVPLDTDPYSNGSITGIIFGSLIVAATHHAFPYLAKSSRDMLEIGNETLSALGAVAIGATCATVKGFGHSSSPVHAVQLSQGGSRHWSERFSARENLSPQLFYQVGGLA